MRGVPAGAQYCNPRLNRYYKFERGELMFYMKPLSSTYNRWEVSAKTRWDTKRILNWIEESLEVV